MGFAQITGGIYPINSAEGEAIAAFTPPPHLTDIDWDALTDAQTWQLSEIAIEWEITAYWLVYFRTRAVDITGMPFTHPDVLSLRPKAELFSIQLDLCAEIWEAVEKIRHIYRTPYDWWAKCMREIQQNQINAILENRDGIPKGVVEDDARSLRRSLAEDVIPFEKSNNNEHLYTMMDCAIKYKATSINLRHRWLDYLRTLKTLARELKKNSKIKSVTLMAKRLYYRDRHTLKPILISRVEKDTVLNIRAKFALLA